MEPLDRRALLRNSGLAAVGGGLVLPAGARPTAPVLRPQDDDFVEIRMGPLRDEPASGELRKVAPFPYGPFYKPGAPFRSKLSLPGEPGVVFVLSGRVWGCDSKRPLAGAVLDFWHVDLHEHYSDGVTDLRNRGRLVSAEDGSYELESVRPIPYRPDPVQSPSFFRCAHFHLLAVCPGYAPLVTEIHFVDEAHKEDSMYNPANAIEAVEHTVNGQRFESGVFDVVLLPE